MNKKSILEKSETDWERLRNMTDDDIDYSDIPPTTPEFWANAVIRKGLKPVRRKDQITLRIDGEVIDYLKGKGAGYQTLINQVLRSFVEADKAAHAK